MKNLIQEVYHARNERIEKAILDYKSGKISFRDYLKKAFSFSHVDAVSIEKDASSREAYQPQHGLSRN